MIQISSIALRDNFFVDNSATILDAAQTMEKNKHGVVAIVDGKKIVGIITEKDIVSLLNNKTNIHENVDRYCLKSVITISGSRSIEHALGLLVDNNIRRLVAVNNNEDFLGIVTQESVIHHLENNNYRIKLKVSNLLSSSKAIVSISPENSIQDAIHLMKNHNIGSVLITEDEKILGIFTERDSIRIISNGIDLDKPITHIMSSPVLSVSINDNLAEVVSYMEDRNVRRVVVLGGEKQILGILSSRDILRNIRGNYNFYLEDKLKQVKETLNSINDSILEVFDYGEEQSIHWQNSHSKNNFGNVLDKEITCILCDSWNNIYQELKKNKSEVIQRVKIKNRYYELFASYQLSHRTNYIRVIFKDITDYEKRVEEEVKLRIQKEKMLIQQSKMASMGEMVGLIAHQWKQPLNALGISIQDIADAHEYGELNKLYIDNFINGSMKKITFLNNTVEDFRSFFKPDKEKKDFIIIDALNDTVNLLCSQFRKINIEIKIEESCENCELKTRGFLNEFKQVILNLLNNSKDAIISNKVKEGLIEINVFKDYDKKNIITFKDNGGGIDEEIIPHIFNQYLSTKNEKGTGIGLYISKIIIEKNMGGKISVKNYKDGAMFIMELNHL